MATRRRAATSASSQVEPSAGPAIDIYARIGRAVNGETVKVDHQIEMSTELIERRGARVGGPFKVNSLSAWNPRVVREDWNRMMAWPESGESDGVWVYDVSRFTREPIEGERLIQAAMNGKRVWSWAGEYDLTAADGRMAFRDALNKAAGSWTRPASGCNSESDAGRARAATTAEPALTACPGSNQNRPPGRTATPANGSRRSGWRPGGRSSATAPRRCSPDAASAT